MWAIGMGKTALLFRNVDGYRIRVFKNKEYIHTRG